MERITEDNASNHAKISSPGRSEPPPEGWLKTNVDRFFFVAETGAAAMGAIIRDHREKNIVVAGKILSNNQNVEEVGTMSRLEGACIAADWDRYPLIIEKKL
jgi:hypothetical protein